MMNYYYWRWQKKITYVNYVLCIDEPFSKILELPQGNGYLHGPTIYCSWCLEQCGF